MPTHRSDPDTVAAPTVRGADGRSSLVLYATSFLLTSALGVVFVFLEDLQTDRGLQDWQIGVIAGTGFGAALVTQLLLSPLADRGVKVPLALLALASGVIGPLGFAYGSSLGVVAFSRGLSGVGLGLFMLLSRKALIGTDTAGGGAKLGILLSTAVAGFIAGPLIGALFEPLGFAAPFIAVSVAIALVGIPATVTILRAEIAVGSVDYGTMGELLRRPRMQAALAVQIIVMSYVGLFDSVVDRHLTGLGASTAATAWAIVVVGAPMLVLPRVAGNLAERFGTNRVVIPATIGLVPVMLGYSVAGSVAAFMIVGFLHGTGESFANIGSQVLVLEVTGAERAAVGTGLLDASGYLAAAIVAGASPPVYGSSGRGLFIFALVGGVLLALVAFQRLRVAPTLEMDRAFATRITAGSESTIF